jgi:hypothetical protein
MTTPVVAETMRDDVIHYAVFSVLLSTLPLAGGYLVRRLESGAGHLQDVTARGELILIAAALVARGLGGILKQGPTKRLVRYLTWSAVATLALTYLMYGIVFAVAGRVANIDAFVTQLSVWTYAWGLLVGFSCVASGAHEKVKQA